MSTHTPGPFTCKPTGSIGPQYAIYSENDPQGRTLAVVYAHDNAEADGRLMAAGPGMLAELKRAKKALADILDNCPYFFPDRGDSSKLTDEQQAWRDKVKPVSRAVGQVIKMAEGGGE